MIALATFGFSKSPTEAMIAAAWHASRFIEKSGAFALDKIKEAVEHIV
jgi:hypothetical protein